MELPSVFGPYVLLKLLDTGATGEVFLARPLRYEQNLPALFVIKRLRKEHAHDDSFVRRFRHEAKVAVAVENPHVAGVFDVGQVVDELYIAMEYVPGWPMTKLLEEMLTGGLVLPVTVALELVVGALTGLAALHSVRDPQTGEALEVVHRDVSPRNVMVNEDGRAQIIDLGIGRSRAQDWETKVGKVLGTPGYMSPEQTTGRPIDQRADLYAMGVVLYELLSGRRLIKPGSPQEMMRASLRPVVVPITSLRADAPSGLDFVVTKALGRKPEQRYPSAQEFLTAIYGVVPLSSMRGHTRLLLKQRYGPQIDERRMELQAMIERPPALAAGMNIPSAPTTTFAKNPRYSSEPFGDADDDVGDNTELSQDHATLLEHLDMQQTAGQPVPAFGHAGTGNDQARLSLESRVSLRAETEARPDVPVLTVRSQVAELEAHAPTRTQSEPPFSGPSLGAEDESSSGVGIVPAPTLIVPIHRPVSKESQASKEAPASGASQVQASQGVRTQPQAPSRSWTRMLVLGMVLFGVGALLGVASRAALLWLR